MWVEWFPSLIVCCLIIDLDLYFNCFSLKIFSWNILATKNHYAWYYLHHDGALLNCIIHSILPNAMNWCISLIWFKSILPLKLVCHNDISLYKRGYLTERRMFTNVANLGFRQGSLKRLHRSQTVYIVANSFSCRREILRI